MARFDVFPNPSGDRFLLDVQSDLLDAINTRVVVPLFPMAHAPMPAKRLNPIFQIGGEDVVMMTQFLAAVPLSILKAPAANLSHQSDEITAAIDMLTHGF